MAARAWTERFRMSRWYRSLRRPHCSALRSQDWLSCGAVALDEIDPQSCGFGSSLARLVHIIVTSKPRFGKAPRLQSYRFGRALRRHLSYRLNARIANTTAITQAAQVSSPIDGSGLSAL